MGNRTKTGSGVLGILCVVALICAAPAPAQTCSQGGTIALASTAACNAVVGGVEILQERMGLAAASGNPIPGASSTLGMRIGRIPRVSLAARFTGINADFPSMEPGGGGSGMLTSIDFDAAVGVFSGFALLPTVGGFGSLDAVASLGKLHLPGDAAADGSPGTWALGARLGILRESFTAPGLSVTAMYRHVGDVSGGGNVPSGSATSFSLRDNSALSIRGVIGKRLAVVGANIGIGYDRYSSDVDGSALSCTAPSCLGSPAATFSEDNLKTNRKTVFANVNWTMLIINLVAEGGWQEGGDRFTGPLPSGESSKTQKSGYYGSLAIRLAL